MYAGVGMGAVYRARVTAVSDEWLLDRRARARENGVVPLALDGRELLARLTGRAQIGGAGVDVARAAEVRDWAHLRRGGRRHGV